jgi:hypothetical protein
MLPIFRLQENCFITTKPINIQGLAEGQLYKNEQT